MKKINYQNLVLFICSISLYSSGYIHAQTKQIASRIAIVENNLLPDSKIIFKDSTRKHFNIYDRMDYYKVPSVSIAVINNGKIEWAKAYGLADLKKKKAVNTTTLYQAASISKSINALCIMKLVQDGRLSLEKDIRKYLKSWTFPDNELSKDKTITIKNLLSHTAGLNLHGFLGYFIDDKIPSTNEILNGKLPANNETIKPIYAPNTVMEYSGGGILITKKILDDNISGNYDSLLKNTIFKPLRMSNSTYLNPDQTGEINFAAGHDENMKETYGKYKINPELAPDGLWTTPTDLAKFIISIQQSIKSTPKSFLNYNNVKEMLTPPLSSSDAALGVFIQEKGGERYFTHTGANIGYRTVYYGSFTTGVGAVIMVNSDNGQIINEIINSIASQYDWKGFYDPEVRTLVNISPKTANDYVGEYYSEKPQMKITIVKKDNRLYLTTRELDNIEIMLFISNNKFYIPSSPNAIAEFSENAEGKADTLIVKEYDHILFKAVKKNIRNIPYPDWVFVKQPDLMGWNIEKLEKLRKIIRDSTSITGYMIVHKGKVVFSYGNIKENSYIASCRKSILSMLYGKYIKSDAINLDKSLKDLGINDIGQLLPSEKEATIRDIISARSGVFHPASNQGDNSQDAPKRGTFKHGEYWLYNNWDFNVAGYIFEKETQHNIYDEVESRLAIPLQMQDWDKAIQIKDGDITKSMFQSYPMWFSTRDMARIGLLMLYKGKWGDKEIIDSKWVDEMTKPRTMFTEVNKNIPDFRSSDYSFGYGYMWWLWQNVKDEKLKGGFSALGYWGQSISVFPEADVVIVYKTKDDYERETPNRERFNVMTLAIDALDNPKTSDK